MSQQIADILSKYDETISSIVGDILEAQDTAHRDLRAAGVPERFFAAGNAPNLATGQIQITALVMRAIAERYPQDFVRASQALYGATDDMFVALEAALQKHLPRNGNPQGIDATAAAATWIDATEKASKAAFQRRLVMATASDDDATLTLAAVGD